MAATKTREVTGRCVQCGHTFDYIYKGGPSTKHCSKKCKGKWDKQTRALSRERKRIASSDTDWSTNYEECPDAYAGSGPDPEEDELVKQLVNGASLSSPEALTSRASRGMAEMMSEASVIEDYFDRDRSPSALIPKYQREEVDYWLKCNRKDNTDAVWTGRTPNERFTVTGSFSTDTQPRRHRRACSTRALEPLEPFAWHLKGSDLSNRPTEANSGPMTVTSIRRAA